MSQPFRASSLLWFVVPFAALAYLLFLNVARLQRVDAVTGLVETEVAVDPLSATGYAGGLRNLIVPEHNNESFQWIVQTQQMLAPDGPWRVREVRYDNAPAGRTILTPSPYRWWLGLVAQMDHRISGRPIGLSVERAARVADPILFILLVVAAVTLVAWRFGMAPAALLLIATITLFPLGGGFVPGQPGDGSLVVVCVAMGVLLLIAGVRTPVETSSREHTPRPAGTPLERGPKLNQRNDQISSREGGPQAGVCWFTAGAVLGLALWVDAVRTVPVVLGIGLGGLLAIWSSRRALKAGVPPISLPWRLWGLGGAVTTLIAYLLEYYPAHLGSFHLREIDPLYGLAWFGLGELLERAHRAAVEPCLWRSWRTLVAMFLSLVALAAIPVTLGVSESRDFFTVDPIVTYLSHLPGSPIAENFWAWLVHNGIDRTVVATCSPLLLLAVAVVLLFMRSTLPVAHTWLTIALGPVVVLLVVGIFQLRGWNEFDAALLGLVVAISATIFLGRENKIVRGAYLAILLLVLAPGAILFTEKALADRREPVSGIELQTLIERDLGHWLAKQAGPGGAVVLAPPNLTTSLIYYGGLSGLGTPFLENKAGFVAATRIAGASTPDEAQAVANGRKLGYIVIPSWDNFLEEYARQGASDAQHTLVALLQNWRAPRWLRPIPYQLPKVPGLEEQRVAIFRVVEVQDNATALSYLAEYFVDMGMANEASRVAAALENSYPADLGAAAARAIVTHALQDQDAFTRALTDLKDALDRGDDEILAWDRRVNLAVALVNARELDQAKEHVKRCLAEIDESHLRSLTTVSLHRLLVMCRSFGLKIENPALSSLAEQLLPPELRRTTQK